MGLWLVVLAIVDRPDAVVKPHMQIGSCWVAFGKCFPS